MDYHRISCAPIQWTFIAFHVGGINSPVHVIELMQPNVSVVLASDTRKICELHATF